MGDGIERRDFYDNFAMEREDRKGRKVKTRARQEKGHKLTLCDDWHSYSAVPAWLRDIISLSCQKFLQATNCSFGTGHVGEHGVKPAAKSRGEKMSISYEVPHTCLLGLPRLHGVQEYTVIASVIRSTEYRQRAGMRYKLGASFNDW